MRLEYRILNKKKILRIITGLIFFSNFSENNIYQLKLFSILKIVQIHFVNYYKHIYN